MKRRRKDFSIEELDFIQKTYDELVESSSGDLIENQKRKILLAQRSENTDFEKEAKYRLSIIRITKRILGISIFLIFLIWMFI